MSGGVGVAVVLHDAAGTTVRGRCDHDVRAVADQVRVFIPHGWRYTVLGTDGYGRSDTRAHLLDFFEVNDRWIAHAAIAALADDGVMNAQDVERAIKTWNLDPAKPNPITV